MEIDQNGAVSNKFVQAQVALRCGRSRIEYACTHRHPLLPERAVVDSIHVAIR
jgi:hypothetical protein